MERLQVNVFESNAEFNATNIPVKGEEEILLGENFTHVKDGLYLIRNQDGIKHAFKHYCKLQRIDVNTVLSSSQTLQWAGHEVSYYPDHPTEYPALVSITRNRDGDSELSVSWVGTNQLKEMLKGY